jgi:hypothetical protein
MLAAPFWAQTIPIPWIRSGPTAPSPGTTQLRSARSISQTTGSSDTALYVGSPDSAGWVGEISYLPSGIPNSDFPNWFNMRLSLQYTAYTKFNGSSAHASDNYTLFLLLWIAG